jgi:twinkle protein
VNVDTGCALCHHCGETFIVKQHASSYGTPPPPVYTRPVYREHDGLADAAVAFFTGRGITRQVWERNRIGYEGGAITFPYYRDGEVINVKHRGRGKKFWLEQGAELLLYGTDDIAPGQPLVWVEGEMDKLAVECAGIVACVSPPNGAPPPNAKNYARHFAYLETQQAALDAVSRHIIAVDADAPGRTLQDELVRRLGPERCWLVTWPQGCKDANEVLEQYGADAVAGCIANARAVPVEGVFEVNDLRAAVLDLYERGLPEGVNAGSDLLARHYRPTPGQWTIVTGIPSHGKSTFIDWLIHGIARRNGWQFAVCSPENQPLQLHIARLATLETGKPFGTGPHRRMERAELGAALDALQEQFAFILPADDFSIDNILAKAQATVYRRGIRGLVIDPWNEIEHTRPAGQREDEHISEVLTKIRRFARKYDVHVWLIAHPRTLQKVIGEGDATYPVPTLYDISGGSQFRNKADMGLSIWRNTSEQGAPTQVHIQKVRFEHCGQIGMVELYYDPVTRRFNDYPVTHRYDERDPWDEEDV